MNSGIPSVQDVADALNPYLVPVQFEKNALIFRESDPADCFYLVDEGVIAIQLEGGEVDSDSVLGFVGSNEVLGELALLDQKARSASAYAQTAVRARRFDFTTKDELASKRPELLIVLLSFLGRQAALKLRHANSRLADALSVGSDPDVEGLVARARAAQPQLVSWTEERIDGLLQALAEAFAKRAEFFAQEAVRITRLGNVPDKTTKNRMASLGVYRYLAGRRGYGLIDNLENNVSEFAAPAGVVFGLIPVTNPVATAIFKTLICLKSRNALILSFHRSTRQLGDLVGELIQSVLKAQGAPVDLVQWVRDRNSRKKTELFFQHPGVSLILATGGSSMVRAAYSSGRPALGVGPGNAPVMICSDADLSHAAASVVMSKSFDNGLICGSEHNLIAVDSVYDPFVAALEAAGAAVLNPAETGAFFEQFCEPGAGTLRRRATGVDAQTLATAAGIKRPLEIKVIVVPTREISPENPMAREKMAPVVGLFRVPEEESGFETARAILDLEGRGHTAVIHSQNPKWIERFAMIIPASRILVNSPATQGVIGFTTGLVPSLTLGCGLFGGNSTNDNVSYNHLVNRKRLAYFIPPKQQF